MAIKTVTLQDASAHLGELVARVGSGEEFLIERGGEPLARLGPPYSQAGERKFGQFRDKIHMSEDFEAPLPDEFWLGRSTE